MPLRIPYMSLFLEIKKGCKADRLGARQRLAGTVLFINYNLKGFTSTASPGKDA